MATAKESNSCSICNKPSSTNHCIGCKQYFCRKDFREHEQQLERRFNDEIISLHDQLLGQVQKLEESNGLPSDLFDEIEQWKNTMIKKIELAAKRVSDDLIALVN